MASACWLHVVAQHLQVVLMLHANVLDWLDMIRTQGLYLSRGCCMTMLVAQHHHACGALVPMVLHMVHIEMLAVPALITF